MDVLPKMAVRYAITWLTAALAGALLSGILCAVVARKPAERQQRVVKACWRLGVVFFGSSIVGIVARLATFVATIADAKPSPLLARMWSDTITDAGFSLVFGVFLAAPPLALSLIAADRAKRVS